MRSQFIAVLVVVGLAIAGASTATAYNSAVDALTEQARSHLNEGDVQRAELIAQRIVRIDPDDARGWALMADIRQAQGNEYSASEYRARARLAGAREPGTQQPALEAREPERVVVEVEPAELAIESTRETDIIRNSRVEQRLPERDTADAKDEIEATTDSTYRIDTEQTVAVIEQPAASRDQPMNDYNDPDYRSRNIIESETGRGVAEERSRSVNDTELERVFADTGAYQRSHSQPASRPRSDAPPRPEYNAEQRSRLDRIRRQHQQQVARLHKKLFGRDRSRSREDRPKAEVVDRAPRSDLSFAGGSNSHNRSTASLVPPGYFPPAGFCRIWYYDLAPQNQPPAGDCDRLRKQLPTGARLLIGSDS